VLLQDINYSLGFHGFLPNFYCELCRPELLEPLAARITHLAGAAGVSSGSPDSPSSASFLECIFNISVFSYFLECIFNMDFVHFLKVVNRVLQFPLFYFFRYQKVLYIVIGAFLCSEFSLYSP